MKKLIALLLAMVMVFSLAACAGNDNTSDDKDDDEEETQELDKDTNEDEEEDEDEVVEEDDEEDTQQIAQGNYEGQVVLDNEDLLFSITGIDYDHELYFNLLFQVENRSSSKLGIDITDILVNGNDYEFPWTNTYEAGISEEGKLRFYYEDCLTVYGEETATCIVLTVEIYDGETYDTLYTTEVTVYPYGEDAA